MIPWNEFEYHESAHMLQTLNFFDSRNRMQKLNSHGAIGRPPVEEEEIATGPRMLHGIFNKIHNSVTFEASKTTKAKVALIMLDADMSDSSIEFKSETKDVSIVTAITY